MSITARKVLIADDNRDLAENLAEILAVEGYEATIADDGEAAVQMATATGSTVDLVLLDVRMPRKDGVTACLEILALRAGLPVVLMTAYASRAEQALAAGARSVVRKPVEIDALLDLLTGLGDA
ncbi:MAG: response regulator [Planctomycetota bacterium]